MKLVATFDSEHKATVQLVDAPAKAVVEVRLQNTFNGHVDVYLKDVGDDGTATLDTDKFGQEFAPSVRVLTDNNQDSFSMLIFDAEQSSADKMTYLTNSDYAAKHAPVVKPAANTGTTFVTPDNKEK